MKPSIKELSAQWKLGKRGAISLLSKLVEGNGKCQAKDSQAALAYLLDHGDEARCFTCGRYACTC